MDTKKKPIVKSKIAKPKKVSARVPSPPSAFPIVGIGASAGGLLQRGTDMQVFQAKNRRRVEANCVCVTPSTQDLSTLRGLHLPIDLFIRLENKYHAGKSPGNSSS